MTKRSKTNGNHFRSNFDPNVHTQNYYFPPDFSPNTDAGTIRPEYYYPIIDTESLLFSLLKQTKCGGNPTKAGTAQGMVTPNRTSPCGPNCSCQRCTPIVCCSNCGNPTDPIYPQDSGDKKEEDDENRLSASDLVFHSQKSFKKQNSSQDNSNNNRKISRAHASLCSINIHSVKAMAQRQQSLPLPPSTLGIRQRSSTVSSASSLSSDISRSSSSKTRRRIVSRLAKKLRDECDKILGHSESLIIDWRMLSAALKEINKAESKFGVDEDSTIAEDSKYHDLVMFLADLFKYTPTLCITYTADTNKSSPEGGPSGGAIDLSRFHNIKFLELKRVSPRTITNLNMVKRSLTTMKCTRCLGSIGQILTDPLLGEAADKKLSCMWPEIKVLDLSLNDIEGIEASAVEALDFCPLIDHLNLSRNRISSIHDSFSRSLNCLSILNLTYNQLKEIPPIPPNVKVLLLAHNYITSLNNSQNSSNRHLETFTSQAGPYRNLEILDVSSNMIASETSLRVLRDIGSLKHVTLDGNPISYMDDYRNVVLSYLNKLAISRHFTLDKKRLASSEVRYAIEQSKKCKYVPQFSSPSSNSMSTSLLMTTSQTMTSSSSRPSPLSHLTSLTQSFESNTSSLRSSRRKKPKIREISSIDFNESYNENVSPDDDESIVRVPMGRSGSALSDNRSILADNGLAETRATIKALRDKYGADNWLLNHHPGRSEVSKIICIPENVYGNLSAELNPSRSLPSHPERRTGERRNSCSRCEGCGNNNNSGDSNDKASSDGISVVASHTNSSGDGSDVGSYSDVYSTNYRSKKYGAGNNSGVDKSSSGVTGDYGATSVDDTAMASTSSWGRQPRNSIFDMKSDYTEEKFLEEPENCEYYRVFIHGQFHNLICFNGFLFEVDPQDSTIYNKWDLNSLISLEEEKCDSETETVEFRLKFNTMRKQMREKSFIMCAKDFAKFDKMVCPYIEKKMMEEFIEALQCTRCNAQFSKAMAVKTVKHEKGRAPIEVLICPDPSCGNEYLVTLDTIPLPNNECLEVDRSSLDNSVPVPIRSSTPCSGEKTLSRSVPKSRSPPIIEAIKNFASSLTSRKSLTGTSPIPRQESSLEERSDSCVSDAKTVATTSSSDTVLNTRSDSDDIEVLSYESSSIEVLNKCGDSESDEVEVPEAEEVPVPEYRTQKGAKGPMSESTSSGSCTESIITQYERSLQLQPISQPFSSPSTPSTSTTTSLSSFASNSTLTSGSANSPNKIASSVPPPVSYDYVNFRNVDHRLQVWSEVSVFKSMVETFLTVVKCMIITEGGNVLGLVIISTLKIYLYKITGTEGEKPQEWLTKMTSYDISKLNRLDVLIGRHGVGVDINGKYFAMIFRDMERTSNFLEFFMCDVFEALERAPPMVRDMSQTQKALMCPTSPLAYFGIVRFSVCDNEYSYPVSAIVLTQEEMIIITDLSWMATKANDTVLAKHCKPLSSIRQIESLESSPTLVRLICDNAKWELLFETEREKGSFLNTLKCDLNITVSSITVCSPAET